MLEERQKAIVRETDKRFEAVVKRNGYVCLQEVAKKDKADSEDEFRDDQSGCLKRYTDVFLVGNTVNSLDKIKNEMVKLEKMIEF
jgi:hypothetical protein